MENLGTARLTLAAALWAGGAAVALAVSPPPVQAEKRMVVTAQHLASEVGDEVLSAVATQ